MRKGIAQRPMKEPPPVMMSKEEIEIMRELDYEFPADGPKTTMGNLLPMETPPPPKDLSPKPFGYPPPKRYSTHKKKLSGVLKGVADNFGMSEMGLFWLRMAYFGVTLLQPIVFVTMYIVASIVMPNDKT